MDQATAAAGRYLAQDQAAKCDMSPLFTQLRGQLERGKVSPVQHPGGVPRGWCPGRFDGDDVAPLVEKVPHVHSGFGAPYTCRLQYASVSSLWARAVVPPLHWRRGDVHIL